MKRMTNKRFVLGFILGAIIFGSVGVYATTKYKSEDISYKNTTVKNALDDLYLKQENDDFANRAYWNFDYTGSEQEFIIPTTGKYKIEVWGSQGASGYSAGGFGAYASGEITLKKAEKLYVYVGSINGYNGGGSSEKTSERGGGATDIRLVNGNWNNFDSLKSRIMVAGGGGGSYDYDSSNTGKGGAAGSFIGFNGIATKGSPATGGTQLQGGIGNNSTSNRKGSFGAGGNGVVGGGGGYYGGGGTYNVGFSSESGGGGSSYISGHKGCIAITQDSTIENIEQRKDSTGKICTDSSDDIVCSYHYSEKIFLNTVLKAGNEEIPNYINKTTRVGNNGNGHARITYLGN